MNQTNKIYQDYKFLWKNRIFLFLLIFFIILNILDWSLTYYGIENQGFKEGNDLFRNCINTERNYIPVLVAKTSFTFLLVLVTFFIFKHYSRLFGYILISLVDLYYLGVVIKWMILLS